ncbi:uncharacterized protein LOC129343047 isoform X2 [Eublepharis macularius]|uniref:Uncharacterized protein LOC129343047 isoform X2 n=1 Tax=Eublepharis macularius TaxID=481883 RepID=A0AA97KGU8_EUBMA|nr:uncharacterized protein LOC129343047 isoform X2 [Eublepharis macularius]
MPILSAGFGSWDSVLSDEPISKAQQLVQNIREYYTDIRRGIDEQLAVVSRSNLAHETMVHIGERFSDIKRHFQKLKTELPSEVSQTFDLVVGIPTGVAEKAFYVFSGSVTKLQPATVELYDRLEPVVNPYAKPVVDQVKTYADALRTGIQELNKNQKEKLALQLEQLGTELGPYIRNVQNRLQEFRVALQPLADEVRERFRENVESATNSLKPHVGPVLEKIREHTVDFKKWVDTHEAQ